MKDTNNMRGLTEVFMVEVLEGKGTEDFPFREVKYFYTKTSGEFVGKIDSFCDKL